MKWRIELDPALTGTEVVIRCGEINAEVTALQQHLTAAAGSGGQLVFYKEREEFYFSPDAVLFFETEGDTVFAHTAADQFRMKQRLYELEELLPPHFVRISKSAIANTRHIFSINRNLAASSLVQFNRSHKQAYVSRKYYPALRQKLDRK